MRIHKGFEIKGQYYRIDLKAPSRYPYASRGLNGIYDIADTIMNLNNLSVTKTNNPSIPAYEVFHRMKNAPVVATNIEEAEDFFFKSIDKH
jgi:hypothetical protein